MKGYQEACSNLIFECDREASLQCIKKKCQCINDNFKFENGKCVLKNPKKYDEDCSSDYAVCTDKNTLCGPNKKCTCFPDILRYGNECRPGKRKKLRKR